jgi:hypothetical protein
MKFYLKTKSTQHFVFQLGAFHSRVKLGHLSFMVYISTN